MQARAKRGMTRPIRGSRILIVDDEPAVVSTLREFFRSCELDVDCATGEAKLARYVELAPQSTERYAELTELMLGGARS